MAKLPKGWRVYGRGDPEGESRRYNALTAHHMAAKPQRGRILPMRRILRHGTLWSLILIGLVALGWRMLSREPLSPPPHPSVWPAEIRAKHRTARRSCDDARAVGLAPASKGYPGYWPHLDADNDGMSCEWSLGVPGISLRALMGGE
jgi:hypothetical protein